MDTILTREEFYLDLELQKQFLNITGDDSVYELMFHDIPRSEMDKTYDLYVIEMNAGAE
jgi:hypothetical protein